MAINKVVYDGTTLIDLSSDTLSSADQLAQGIVAHDRTGAVITGTGGTPAVVVTEEPDTGGGIVKNITALDISDTTAVASDVAQGKYFYTADGTKTAGTASGGGGLEYETGTWTPTEDVANPTINFADSHTNPPISIIFYDATGTEDFTGNSDWVFAWSDFSQVGGVPISISSTANGYAKASLTVRTTSTTSFSSWQYDVRTPYSDTSASSNYQYRYWVTASRFCPFANQSSRYCRVGRTYKWIAVWAPTT